MSAEDDKMTRSALVKRWVGPAQAWLVRSYKLLGLFALAMILIGLIGFLIVNVFYLLDSSWIRPEILSPSHERVVEVTADIAEQTARRNTLTTDRDQLKAELGALERTQLANQRFEAEVEASGLARGTPGSYEALMAWREHDRSALERAALAERRGVIESKLAMLDASIAQYDQLIAQLEASPYIAARDHDMTVAFVPYENLDTVRKGQRVFGCKLGLLWCKRVGTVGRAIKGEVQNSHPHSGAMLRGVMFEVHLDAKWAAEEEALFVGGRPFWIL